MVTDENIPTDMLFDVVINTEAQYSIWPAGKPLPEGWSSVGMQGEKAACLDYIRTNWVDMRPLSLRRDMAKSPP